MVRIELMPSVVLPGIGRGFSPHEFEMGGANTSPRPTPIGSADAERGKGFQRFVDGARWVVQTGARCQFDRANLSLGRAI